jgi:hypothetical protein
MAVVGKRVIGFGSAVRNTEEYTPLVQITGNVRSGVLTGTMVLIFDPQERAESGTKVGTIKARVSKKRVKGRANYVSLPGTPAETAGDFHAEIIPEDVESMREFSGVYDGEVIYGFPKFKAEAILGSNGTFTIQNIFNPDGKQVPLRTGGVYMLGEPFNSQQFDRLIYALPLPWSNDTSVAREYPLVELLRCACCDDPALYTPPAQSAASSAATTASQEFITKFILEGGNTKAPYNYQVRATKR